MPDSREFFDALFDDFERHGVSVIERLREENPLEYLKLIASVVTQDIRVTLNASDSAGEAGRHGKR